MITITIAYIINILVAGTLGFLLFFNIGNRMIKVYGEDTSARQILACLYLSIAIFSIIALVHQGYFFKIAIILFPMQIVYKLLTLISVKDKRNPVPYANLAISAYFIIPLWYIISNGFV